jgi:hypothetical protein
VKERGPSNESLLCPGDHRTALAFSYARCCRHYLSDTAVPRVRRHRLHPNCGAVRDSGAIISPQVIPAGFKAVVLLLRSLLLTGDQSRKLKVGDAFAGNIAPPTLAPLSECPGVASPLIGMMATRLQFSTMIWRRLSRCRINWYDVVTRLTCTPFLSRHCICYEAKEPTIGR